MSGFQVKFEPELDEELDHTSGDGRKVRVMVSKVGGGTLGRAYTGRWEYAVVLPTRNDETAGVMVLVGSDLETGMPKTHAEAAKTLLEIAEDVEEGGLW
jgi:hypothetical protein